VNCALCRAEVILLLYYSNLISIQELRRSIFALILRETQVSALKLMGFRNFESRRWPYRTQRTVAQLNTDYEYCLRGIRPFVPFSSQLASAWTSQVGTVALVYPPAPNPAAAAAAGGPGHWHAGRRRGNGRRPGSQAGPGAGRRPGLKARRDSESLSVMRDRAVPPCE
jgi:hypothetical protein